MHRVRVILAAHGEAESAGFVENFRVSRRTLAHAAEVMRLPAPLRLAICGLGGLRKRLGGRPGSAHNENTRQQAAALQTVLGQHEGASYRVEAAFASSSPYLEDAIRLPEDVDRQFVVSMIPTDSRLSCGLICHALLAASTVTRERTAVIARMWGDQELAAIHRDHIVSRFPPTAPQPPCCLVLVLHGTIVRDKHGRSPGFHTGVEEKATYGDALRAELLALPDRPWQRVELAYLNHGVGGQWSGPTLPELLKRLEREGVRSVVAYPCEHLVEGGETTRLPEVLAAGGLLETHQLPCLNATGRFIDYLAKRLHAASASPRTLGCCNPCPMRG